jgi:hypothetical protein
MRHEIHIAPASTQPRSDSGICWRPWPCASCSGGTDPISHLVRSYWTGEKVPDGDRNQTIEWFQQHESKILLEWLEVCPHTKWTALNLPLFAEGSEHLVFYDVHAKEVVKITRPELYGDYYEIIGGKIHQFNCTPVEYLLRSAWWEFLFSTSPLPLGMTTDGQILSRQKFIKGDLPNQDQVNCFLEESGLIPVRKNCWLWKKAISSEETEIWVGDARADNFVSTANGIVPIDIRVWGLPAKQSEISLS